MTTLNRHRACIVYTNFRRTGIVLNPSETSRRERVFEYDGALRDDSTKKMLGTGKIGTSLSSVLRSPRLSSIFLDQDFMRIFHHEQYILLPDFHPRAFSPSRRHFYIWFKDSATTTDHLKAWLHAVEMSRIGVSTPDAYAGTALVSSIASAIKTVNEVLPPLLEKLQMAGWNTTVGAIVTNCSTTIHIDSFDNEKKEY